ncbi:MAG: MBL fold metallo-hydrolase [Bacteroidota bacterium]|nr:MBL fold metallo-hydrolase [Bacteroidota bacterium]
MSVTVKPVMADIWKMDGGVTFGVVPKALWTRSYPEDENNLVKLASRCLLIESEGRKILVNAGMGRKQNAKYYKFKYIDDSVSLLDSLKNIGVSPDEITDVLFTHLHDDHVGGATVLNENGDSVTLFKNADYWCSETQWNWAINPNIREAASFLPENLIPLRESGRLKFTHPDKEFVKGVVLKEYEGHTKGLLVPIIDTGSKVFAYVSDLIPLTAHIPLVYISSVDIQPMKVLEEKESFLNEVVENNYTLLFEHDYYTECATVLKNEKGFKMKESLLIDNA